MWHQPAWMVSGIEQHIWTSKMSSCCWFSCSFNLEDEPESDTFITMDFLFALPLQTVFFWNNEPACCYKNELVNVFRLLTNELQMLLDDVTQNTLHNFYMCNFASLICTFSALHELDMFSGNPRVTPEVTRDVCLLARMMAANLYFSQIEDLMFEVTIGIILSFFFISLIKSSFWITHSFLPNILFSSLCGAAVKN